MKKNYKRFLSMLLLVVMLVGVIPFNAFAANNSGEYDWQGKWIWTNHSLPSGKDGQWVDLRKTFTLNSVPATVEARISVDSRYWMWINGEMAVYEGQLKGGPDKHSWYYDVVDIAPFLKEGENTIAILACYWGFQSASAVPTKNQGLLFDAIFPSGALTSGTRLISDDSWKVQKDPAYKAPPERKNARPDAVDVKYDARDAVEDWQTIGFDDSSWAKATVKTLSETDPRNNLVERSIPHWKVYDISKHGPDDWMVKSETKFSSLSLPDSYTVTAEVKSLNNKAIGIAVCMSDKGHFYMPQINGAGQNIRPHRQNGSWKTDYTLENASPVKSDLNSKMTVTVEVTGTTITTYVNGENVGSYTDSTLARQGSSVGFRQSSSEETAVYSMKVTDASGNLLWEDNISESKAGDEITCFNNVSGTPLSTIKTDSNGDRYMHVKNAVVIAGEQVDIPNSDKVYSFYNSTNIQGAPYLKVKSAEGGELIHITSDATRHDGGEAVSHYYVTKAGEQEWEAFSWTNAYRVDVSVPAGVEVLELGFRQSSYNTEHTGNVTTDNALMNQLYKEAYDTLLVTMRDTYMDCPDRERTQWWGDAVLEMQQAAYAMDEDARYLYKKLLTQVVGWAEGMGGSLPTTPTNNSYNELHTQSVSGVYSLWQYYMYYGETEILETCYQPFLDFLKLWEISDTGYLTHRAGTSDWIDWGVEIDAGVSDHAWHYLACISMRNVAELLGKPQADVDFLNDRINLIKENFDTMFWNEELGAYYSNAYKGKPDDRAQAMAVYAGLADPVHYPKILEIFKTTENSSPYMEKYVLESLYMMGYAEEAVERMLKRYDNMLKDDHPTLWEEFEPKNLSCNGGQATRNHAWSSGPLSLMYMYTAGITPTEAGFKTFQIRPQLGSLNTVSAKTETMYGVITVDATKTSLSVNVPTGTTAEICVPRLDSATTIKLGGVVVYDNGTTTANIPSALRYIGEDTDYVRFTVGTGSYNFTMTEDGADTGNSFTVTASNGGTVTVNGVTVNGTYTHTGTGNVTVKMTPADGYRVASTVGSFNETIYSTAAVERTVTLNGDATMSVVFDKSFDQKHLIKIADRSNDGSSSVMNGMFYAFRLFVNGKEVHMKPFIGDKLCPMVALPYMVTAENGETVTVEVKPVDERNYNVYLGDGSGKLSTKITLTATSDVNIDITVVEKAGVNKLKIQSATASNENTSSSAWALKNLYDGIRASKWDGANGYGSTGFATDTPSKPITLTFDLGSVQSFNQVSLFPRSAFESLTGGARCFPKDFTISVSKDGTNYETVVTITNAPDPYMQQQTYNFQDVEAQYVKLTVSKVGSPEMGVDVSKSYRLQLAEIEIAKIKPEPVINNPVVDNNKNPTPDNTTEPENTEASDDVVIVEEEKKGCRSSVGCGSAIVLISTAAACFLGKKSKKKDN